MYVVRSKKTEEVLFINYAPLKDKLSDKEVWPDYDGRSMEILKSKLEALPAEYKLDKQGYIVAMTNSDRIEAGLLELEPDQKLKNGHIVEKTTAEKVAEGLLVIDQPFEYVSKDDRIAERPIADVVTGGHLESLAHCDRADEIISRHISMEIEAEYPTGKEISLIKNYLYWMADGQPKKDEREREFFAMKDFTQKVKATYAPLRETVARKRIALSKPAPTPAKKPAATTPAKTVTKKAAAATKAVTKKAKK